MINVQSTSFLRRVLLADALTCVATGLLLLLGARFLEPLLGLPVALLQNTGLVLLPIAGFIAHVGTRVEISRRLVWVVIAGNVLWVMDSAALLMSGWILPTTLGQAFIVAQTTFMWAIMTVKTVSGATLPEKHGPAQKARTQYSECSGFFL
jgi:hypothetical protein